MRPRRRPFALALALGLCLALALVLAHGLRLPVADAHAHAHAHAEDGFDDDAAPAASTPLAPDAAFSPELGAPVDVLISFCTS